MPTFKFPVPVTTAGNLYRVDTQEALTMLLAMLVRGDLGSAEPFKVNAHGWRGRYRKRREIARAALVASPAPQETDR